MSDYRKRPNENEITTTYDKRSLEMFQFLIFTFLFGTVLALYAGSINFEGKLQTIEVLFITLFFLIFSFNIFSFYKDFSSDYKCNKIENVGISSFIFFNFLFIKQTKIELIYLIQANLSLIKDIVIFEYVFTKQNIYFLLIILLIFLSSGFLNLSNFLILLIASLLSLAFMFVFKYICKKLPQKYSDTREMIVDGI